MSTNRPKTKDGTATMKISPPGKSWTSTLRLPKSSFPNSIKFGDQQKFLRRCSDDLYEWQSRERSAQEPFVLHDGPPYANGSLHVGHALNKILKDIILRVKVQQGRRVVYVPGWDCHGLPIEIKALEKHRETLKDTFVGENVLDSVGIRRAARKLATKAVKEQKDSFKGWAIMADWEKAWSTMDKAFEIRQLKVFQEMVNKGLIFRRFKPVHWSPSSKTALAEAELEYTEDHKSLSAYIKFPLATVPEHLKKKLPKNCTISAVIWTTTPWTLPANRAIAIHSDLEYCVVKMESDLLLVAKTRLPEVTKRVFRGSQPQVVLECITGKDLVGAQYYNTLRGNEAELQPVIHADFVSADSGSGLVHLAPGHGSDDYEVCTRSGIEAVAPVDDAGCFTAAALPDNPQALQGKAVLEVGTQAVLDILGEDHVLATYMYRHKYPYDWRTKLPIIERATEQWFADVGKVKEDAMKSLGDVKFIPEGGRTRLESFIRGRSEWCISRQRAWGVPIPALYDENGKAILTDESVAHIISTISVRGIDAWWTDAADDKAWIVPGLAGNFTRGRDTMDVWFDSGTSWTQTEQQADVYLEGTDQHRGWFQSSLLTHVSASGKDVSPFKTLITHGFTLDGQGKKMSKSKGNVVAPIEIIDGSLLPPAKKGGNLNHGPDGLRLWVASSDYTRDVIISKPVLQFNHQAMRKYRLTIKMLLGSLHPEARTATLTKLDQIALAQLESVMNEVALAYDNFEFHKGVNAINKWITTDLSAFYMEALKDRLYCGDGGGVLEEIFHGLLRMLTPITPNLVEEAWEYRPQWMKEEQQVHPFHRTLDDLVISPDRYSRDETLLSDLPWLMNANIAIKAAQEESRADKEMGSSLQSSVVLEVPAESNEIFRRYADDLATIFVVSSIDMSNTSASGRYSAAFDTPGGKGTAWVLPPKDRKCPRCWRYIAPAEDELCIRCDDIVNAQPEEVPSVE